MRIDQVVRLSLLAAVFACASSPRPVSSAPFGPEPPPDFVAVPVPVPMVAGAGDLDITFDVDVGEPLMIAGQPGTAYIKITLGGFALPAASRSPINLALVLDRSSSMSGDKLEKAKEAALMVVERLQPDDIISVVSYDSTVEVLVPATRAVAKDVIRHRIQMLTPRGSTALFAGVTFGLEEVGKNLDPKRVNRVVLLSDGQANVGPMSPNELGRLGEVAARQGISISTIGLGLGYNEDLMAQLALRSDGNHAFAENAVDLAKIFHYELGDILSVVAQDVNLDISFADGVVPVRAIGREATINGRRATLAMKQLYAKQEKHVLFEVKVPAGAVGQKRGLADVGVSYANMASKKRGTKRQSVDVEFSSAPTAVAAKQNRAVLEAAVEAISNDENRRAVTLRDQGKVKEAEVVLQTNADYLKREATKLRSQKLQESSLRNARESVEIKTDYSRARKSMRENQTKSMSQRSW